MSAELLELLLRLSHELSIALPIEEGLERRPLDLSFNERFDRRERYSPLPQFGDTLVDAGCLEKIES
jgi:hypothetical protein